MVTQYDMASGERIDVDEPAADRGDSSTLATETALRLLSIDEAAAPERRVIRLPVDVADLPVALFLDRWT